MSNTLIHFSPIVFKDKNISNSVPGLSNFLELQKLFSLHVGINDRTGTIRTPFRQKILNPLPEFTESFRLSYTECALLRVAELERIHVNTGKTFRLLYSGGIDSSGIFAAFVEYFGIEKTSKILEISCSKESKYENPWVWDRYIAKNNFKLISSHKHTDFLDDNVITIMGEGNDLLVMMNLFIFQWQKFIVGKHQEFCLVDESLIRDFFSSLYGIQNEIAITSIIKIIRSSPFPLENMYQILWWLHMALSWDSIILRVLLSSNNIGFKNDRIIQFYNTPEFQKWSFENMRNFDRSIIFQYKVVPKNMTIDLLKISEYKDKGKALSWPRLQSMIPYGLMIDDDFNVYHKIEDFFQFIDTNNSFID